MRWNWDGSIGRFDWMINFSWRDCDAESEFQLAKQIRKSPNKEIFMAELRNALNSLPPQTPGHIGPQYVYRNLLEEIEMTDIREEIAKKWKELEDGKTNSGKTDK